MYCSKCGKKISEKANFCMYCGSKVDKQEPVEEENEVIEETVVEEEPVKEESVVQEETVKEESNEKTVVEAEVIEPDDSNIEAVKEEATTEENTPKVETIEINNDEKVVEEKKDSDKASLLSVVFAVNIIYTVFKLIALLLICTIMNSGVFNMYMVQILRSFGLSGNFSFIKVLIYFVMAISLVLSVAITLLEYQTTKNNNKADMIVSFILTCILYGYLSILGIILFISSFSLISILLIALSVFMIITTYKTLKEIK